MFSFAVLICPAWFVASDGWTIWLVFGCLYIQTPASSLLLAEILAKRLYQCVVTDTASPIECVQRGQLIDENPCVFIDNKAIERLLEKKVFDEGSLVDGSGPLEHWEESSIFLCVEPHNVAVHGRVGLESATSAVWVSTHKNKRRHRRLRRWEMPQALKRVSDFGGNHSLGEQGLQGTGFISSALQHTLLIHVDADFQWESTSGLGCFHECHIKDTKNFRNCQIPLSPVWMWQKFDWTRSEIRRSMEVSRLKFAPTFLTAQGVSYTNFGVTDGIWRQI